MPYPHPHEIVGTVNLKKNQAPSYNHICSTINYLLYTYITLYNQHLSHPYHLHPPTTSYNLPPFGPPPDSGSRSTPAPARWWWAPSPRSPPSSRWDPVADLLPGPHRWPPRPRGWSNPRPGRTAWSDRTWVFFVRTHKIWMILPFLMKTSKGFWAMDWEIKIVVYKQSPINHFRSWKWMLDFCIFLELIVRDHVKENLYVFINHVVFL